MILGVEIRLLIGIPLFVAIMAAACWALARAARADGVARPVLVGALLRFAVMAAVHIGSLLAGDGGVLYLDDGGYAVQAEAVSEAWLAGNVIDPAGYEYVGTYTLGYPLLAATVFLFVGPSMFAVKCVNVLIGALIVLLTARLAERLLGARAKVPAAWVAALLPTMIWWSAPMLKESLSALLLLVALLALLSLPRLSAAVTLALSLAALSITRSPAALAVLVVFGLGAVLAAPKEERRRRALLFGGVLGAAFMALLVFAGRGQPLDFVASLRVTVERMIDLYRGSGALNVPYDVGRSLAGPYPWAFDSEARTWDMGQYPGMWVLYALYPTLLVGIWRLRRHVLALSMLVAPVLFLLVLNSFIAGLVFRQRSTIEPLFVLLIVAGMTSTRDVLLRGSLAIGAVAAIATVHSGSILIGAAIACGAAALLVASRRAPRTAGPGAELDPTAGALALGVDRGEIRGAARSVRETFGRLRGGAPAGPPVRVPAGARALQPALAAGSAMAGRVSRPLRLAVAAARRVALTLRFGAPRVPAMRARSARGLELLRAAGPRPTSPSAAPPLENLRGRMGRARAALAMAGEGRTTQLESAVGSLRERAPRARPPREAPLKALLARWRAALYAAAPPRAKGRLIVAAGARLHSPRPPAP